MPFFVVHWIFSPSELWIGYAVCIFFTFSFDNSCFNLKDLSSTIHGWVSYKYPSADAHIWALDILLSPECCEWQVTVSWSKYGVHLTTARVHSPKRRIPTTKHQTPSTIPSPDHFFEFLFSQFSTGVTVRTGWSMSCQRHIWANGCYRTRPSELSCHLTWSTLPRQTARISKSGLKRLYPGSSYFIKPPVVTSLSACFLACPFFHTLRDTPECERPKMG